MQYQKALKEADSRSEELAGSVKVLNAIIHKKEEDLMKGRSHYKVLE